MWCTSTLLQEFYNHGLWLRRQMHPIFMDWWWWKRLQRWLRWNRYVLFLYHKVPITTLVLNTSLPSELNKWIQAVWRQGRLLPKLLRRDVWLQDFWCQRHLTPRHLTLMTFDDKTFDARFGVSDIWRRIFNANENFQTFVAGHLTPVWIFRHLSTDI